MLKKLTKLTIVCLAAAILFTGFSTKASEDKKDKKVMKLSKDLKVGDTVYFGRYEQDGNKDNGKEKIEWLVLEKEGNKALLISKKVLDIKPYNKRLMEITWETCTLRTWLNKDFMKVAFTSKESKKIEKSKIENKGNKECGTNGGGNTTDQVFLLSIDEAKKYYKTDEKRIAEITNYGIKRLAKLMKRSEKDIKENWFRENKNWYYWLRSPGCYQNFAAFVDNKGGVASTVGNYVDEDDYQGVRPAIWVNP